MVADLFCLNIIKLWYPCGCWPSSFAWISSKYDNIVVADLPLLPEFHQITISLWSLTFFLPEFHQLTISLWLLALFFGLLLKVKFLFPTIMISWSVPTWSLMMFLIFKVACTRLYKPLCLSVGPSVRWSVKLHFFNYCKSFLVILGHFWSFYGILSHSKSF